MQETYTQVNLKRINYQNSKEEAFKNTHTHTKTYSINRSYDQLH